MTTPAANPDENLLFAILAWQMNFVGRDDLLAGMDAWMQNRSKPLSQILCEQGALRVQDRHLLDQLVHRHLETHHGDPRQSLAALQVPASIYQALHCLGPTSVKDSLAALTIPPPPVPFPDPDPPASGRYRALHLHARGGLGVVLLAEDTELHRQVALKEIQDRYSHLPDCRSRFLFEAEITARLEHPGVVPVHGLGTYADGRPFYAMRFIRGRSLHDAICQFHQPAQSSDPGERALALRDLLGRFVAVCKTIGYAHSQGVLHRDLKPANVMLGDFGETLVVDWGLARCFHQPGGENLTTPPMGAVDSGGTRQGQLVGTLAFMPPEQALGRLDLLGPASDVFALGATLYCLLTGQPPYGNDSTLLQIQEGIFPPPRQIAPKTPRALEAVCLKSMAGLPVNRYASAVALAQDVERWLADEPVSALPEPLTDRARRWARRHRTTVSVGIALLLASVVGLAVGLWAVGVEQRETARQRDRARDAEGEARASQQQAEANLSLAKQAADDCFRLAERHPLFQQPNRRRERALLLERALHFYRNFRESKPGDQGLARGQGEQQHRIGTILHELGRPAEAALALEKAREAFTEVMTADPDNQESRHHLAQALVTLGVVRKALGQPRQAEEVSAQALALLDDLARARPKAASFQDTLARVLGNRANLLAERGQSDEARQAYQRARDIRLALVASHPDEASYRQELAVLWNNLADLARATGRLADAARAWEEAIRIQTALVSAHPVHLVYQRELALMRGNLGGVRHEQGRLPEASNEYQHARLLQARLAPAFLDVPAFRFEKALTESNLGFLLHQRRQDQEAAEILQSARDALAALVDGYPRVLAFRHQLARTLFNLALVYQTLAQTDRAIGALVRSRDIHARLIRARGDVPTYQDDLADTRQRLALLLHDRGNREGACQELTGAIALWHQLIRKGHASPETRRSLFEGLWLYARLLDERGLHAEAVPVWVEAEKLAPDRSRMEVKRSRAVELARQGLYSQADHLAQEASSASQPSARACFDLARLEALSASGLKRDSRVPLPVREKQAESRARKAVEHLRQAWLKGYFRGRKHLERLHTETDLNCLRERDDFRGLLAEIHEPGNPQGPGDPG